ncbi:hypothetical protein EPO44_13835 [bacterium]|nr:MAG: hypothetical protein EPO44_13835 [bacterium]
MRILLDECMPRKLKGYFEGHTVHTVPEMGWASKRNGELLHLATGRFDVLVTVDRTFAHQRNLSGSGIAVILLAARSNRLANLLPLMPEVNSRLPNVQLGQVVRIGA